MMDNTDEIMKKYGADSFEYTFWQQQKEAASQKQRCQIRWHPMIIYWCLHLKFMSSSDYDAFRSSGIVILPSECTLRDNNIVTGCQQSLDLLLMLIGS